MNGKCVRLKIRNLITLTMIIAGIVLIGTGFFAAMYYYAVYIPVATATRGSFAPLFNVYPNRNIGVILLAFGIFFIVTGFLLSLISKAQQS